MPPGVHHAMMFHGEMSHASAAAAKSLKNAVGYRWLYEYEGIVGNGIWPEQ